MPGLVVFGRRWSVASDDFVFPCLILLIVHLAWLLIMSLVLVIAKPEDWEMSCMAELHELTTGFVVILAACVLLECYMLTVSRRGAIMDIEERASMVKLIYIKVLVLVMELTWAGMSALWLNRNYTFCFTRTAAYAKDTLLGITVTSFILLFAVLVAITCSIDCSGRSYTDIRYKSRGLRRNDIHGDDDDEKRWCSRCRLFVCCLHNTDRHHGSLAEVVSLMSNLIDEVDLVPSDVAAGLVILRKLQQMYRRFLIEDERNLICDFLSGVRITSSTQFLDVNSEDERELVQDLIHYMRYSMASYGWPVAVISRSRACIQLFSFLHCHCCPGNHVAVHGDNACHCNEAAFRSFFESADCELLFANYNVQITEPSFFVAIDYEKQAIVIVVRGTLSLDDMITDLNLTADALPVNSGHSDWFGHKGMIRAAEYIRDQLLDGNLLIRAFGHATDRGSASFSLVLVGHSLGAGTASILAMLLQPLYPDLQCYAFSPPGVLSLPAALFSRTFITSVVLGKDVVPRLGLYQIHVMQQDILAALEFSPDPKWKVIGSACCPMSSSKDTIEEQICQAVEFWGKRNRDESVTRADSDGRVLVPPGKILHIVRSHPRPEQQLHKHGAVHQALWCDNQDFQDILISPVMVQDHLPHNVLAALENLLKITGPPKPDRLPSFVDPAVYSYIEPIYTSIAPIPLASSCGRSVTPDSLDTLYTQRLGSERLVMETSFTDLRPSSLYDRDSEYGRSSISGKPSFLSALRHHKKVDLFRHDWIRAAPLASPESLSLTSGSEVRDANNVRRPVNSGVYGARVQRSSSRVSMQELIDVFSGGSDSRSLEEMIQEAKRLPATPIHDAEIGKQQLQLTPSNGFPSPPAQDISLLF